MQVKHSKEKTPGRRVASALLNLASYPPLLAGVVLNELIASLNWVRLRYVDYVPRPDDIFVVTYPRSGTTWLQMILYQLATLGEMDFVHISEHVPWFERFPNTGRSVTDLPSPRLFKSHLPFHGLLRSIPKGPGRYIYLARNGKDVAVSYYHFYTTHLGFSGTFADFFELFMRGRVQYGSWFRHVSGWWDRREDPNVLFLQYGDLIQDLPGSIHRIAAFCGIHVDPDRLPTILERCSFAYMKQHESQFDHLTELLWENRLQKSAFLRKGKSGGWRELMDMQQEARFDREFAERLGKSGIIFRASPGKV